MGLEQENTLTLSIVTLLGHRPHVNMSAGRSKAKYLLLLSKRINWHGAK